MSQRLSVPVYPLLHIAALTVAAIAVARDFHFASFIGGVVIAVVMSDACRFFHRPKDAHHENA
jgi:hypothetical protein